MVQVTYMYENFSNLIMRFLYMMTDSFPDIMCCTDTQERMYLQYNEYHDQVKNI